MEASVPAHEHCNDHFEMLRSLAFDLGIRWSQANEDIWRELNAKVWQMTHNPCLVLNAVSREKIDQHLADDGFLARVQQISEWQQQQLAAPCWFSAQDAAEVAGPVAYFSMEYMLSEALPIYSGGLGNVAGDQLKAASDLGVPVVAVGVLWQHGYFRQEVDSQGVQHALFPVNDTRQMPVEPLLQPDGSLLRMAIELPGLTVWLRGWQVSVGRNRLLLIDSNDSANPVPVRLITEQLYGGDTEMRLRQEIVLGIGGWRMVEAAGYQPRVCHLNDGHAAFAVLERARSYMRTHQVSFSVALTATRAGNLFTTHTPVSAGFDCFEPELIRKYLGHYVEHELEQSFDQIMALGKAPGDSASASFNMAFLAMRGSGAVNAVSELHGHTSRRIFEPLFRRFPSNEVPIGYIVNGIHLPTWVSLEAQAHWHALHADQIPWRGGETVNVAQMLAEVDDTLIWSMRGEARASLLVFVREQLAISEAVRGESLEVIAAAGARLDPNVLTLGFARRFATYKRPNLLLQDPERLLRILNHPTRPVQLLIAGKAHPLDLTGQQMIQQWHGFIARPETQGRVAFIEDYDMRIARHLVQGVDVWINTPRSPWEACGTSGMKILANGGLNLSQLDGWWAEAFADDVGWAVGDGQEHGSEHDDVDARQLYSLLEEQVAPAFYDRAPSGEPNGWISRMRRSMQKLVGQYSADRAVREYVEHYYLPLARGYERRTRNHSALAIELVDVIADITRRWADLRIVDSTCRRAGNLYHIQLDIALGGVATQCLRVQLYRAGDEHDRSRTWDLTLRGDSTASGRAVYEGQVPDDCPESAYTGRVMVNDRSELFVPLEVPLILWGK
jgi:starch phosphorylase